MALRPLSIYLHYPFCVQKCTYCNFNKYVYPGKQAKNANQPEEIVSLLKTEAADLLGKRLSLGDDVALRSVYFGGGTPSLMRGDQLSELVQLIFDETRKGGAVVDAPTVEVTLEANPSDVDPTERSDLSALLGAVNRVSLGIQALDNAELSALGRTHTSAQAQRSFEFIYDNCGLTNVSVDFIYGRPGQRSVSAVEAELHDAAVTRGLFRGGHASIYELTYEKGTPLYNQGRHSRHEDETVLAMGNAVRRFMTEDLGWENYEISSYVDIKGNGQRSQHNQSYWTGVEYLGIGPGAHGRVRGDHNTILATVQAPGLNVWSSLVTQNGHATVRSDVISTQRRAEELIMGCMRRKEGLNIGILDATASGSIRDIFPAQLMDDLLSAGYIQLADEGTTIRVPPSKWALTDGISRILAENVLLSSIQGH
eukprot:Clim_evm67s11 gene=Clim_evmTU67s11